MKTNYPHRTTGQDHLATGVIAGGSALRTTTVRRTSGSGRGPWEWSYPPKRRGRRRLNSPFSPRTLCRSFGDLHSADAKPKKTARAGEEEAA